MSFVVCCLLFVVCCFRFLMLLVCVCACVCVCLLFVVRGVCLFVCLVWLVYLGCSECSGCLVGVWVLGGLVVWIFGCWLIGCLEFCCSVIWLLFVVCLPVYCLCDVWV